MDPNRATTEKLDEPAIVLELDHTPVPGIYLSDFTETMKEGTYKNLVAAHGWPLIDKDKQPTDRDFMRGEVMVKVTKYEAGKALEAEIIGCGDPAIVDGDPPEKANAIKEFVIGPISAPTCVF